MHWLFAVIAAAAVSATCANTVLKSVFRSECTNAQSAPSDSTAALRPATAACLALASLNLLIHIASFSLRPLSERGSAALAAIASSWTPQYFIFLSLQQIVLTAVVSYSAARATDSIQFPCSSSHDTLAASSMRGLSYLLIAVSAMCCDLDKNLTPAIRRCAYCLFALCSALEVVGSLIWGNAHASGLSMSLGAFEFFLETHITSCMSSQFVITLRFAFVSCRCRSGRAWSYAPLRFELQDGTHGALEQGVSSHDAAEVQEQTSACGRLHRRVLMLHGRALSNCRVFSIPCAAIHNADDGGSAPGRICRELSRPLLRIKYAQLLQRLAEAHPACYMASLVCFTTVPAFVFSRESPLLPAANVVTLVMGIVFFSSRRHNLDRVASQHVASSFRFLYSAVLWAVTFALITRQAYRGADQRTYWSAANQLAMALVFLLSLLLDCSPRVPPAVQFLISVMLSLSC